MASSDRMLDNKWDQKSREKALNFKEKKFYREGIEYMW